MSSQPDIVLLPSEPAAPGTAALYPTSSLTLVKLLRQVRLTVEYSEPKSNRAMLDLRASDLILPALLFTHAALASGAGALLADAVRVMIGKGANHRVRLRLDVGVTYGTDSRDDWFHAEGGSDEVLKAFEAWTESRD